MDGGSRKASAESGHRSVIAFVIEKDDIPAEIVLADGAKVLAAATGEPIELIEESPADDTGEAYSVHFRDAVSPASFKVIAGGDFDVTMKRLPKARAIKADIIDGVVVGIPKVLEVVEQQADFIQATEAAGRLVSQLANSVAALAPSLAAKEGRAVSPQVAYALAQEEQDLRVIEEEFGWLDSGGVAERLGKKRSRTLASSMRAKGQLVGYARRGQQGVRFPKFQFDGLGVLPVISELIRVANEWGVAHEDLLFWICAPTGMLQDDARPVDMLRTKPDDVVAAAAYDLGGHSW